MSKEVVAIAPGQIILRRYEEKLPELNQVCIRSELSAEKHGTTLTFCKGLTSHSKKIWDDELELFLPQKGGTSIFPLHLGNITVGTVTKTGREVARFKVGDRVWSYLPIRKNHIIEEDRVHLVPPGLRDEQIVCIDPAVVALMSVREARFSLGDKVAIFGLGAIGLLVVQMVKLSGATFVVGIDPVSSRRKLAKKYGADLTIDPTALDAGLEIKLATEKKGVDIAMEVSGSYKALHQAIRGTRYGGTIVPVSFYHGEAKDLNLGEEWHLNRYRMVSGIRVESEPYRDHPRWDRQRIYKTVIELFQKKNLIINDLLHIVDFGDVLEAYRTIDEHPDRWIKLAVKYRRGEK